MKRKTSKWHLRKADCKPDLSIVHYNNGTIVLEDYEREMYFVFDSLEDAVRFVSNNYAQ